MNSEQEPPPHDQPGPPRGPTQEERVEGTREGVLSHELTETLLTREGDLSVSIGARAYTPAVLDVHVRYWSHKGDFVQWLQRDEALALLAYLKRYEGALQASMDGDADEPFAAPREATPATPHRQEQHLLLRGLMEALPIGGSIWPQEQRQGWLALAQSIFTVLYRDASGE